MKQILKNAPLDFVMALALEFRLSEEDLHILGYDINYSSFIDESGFIKPGIFKNEAITDNTLRFLMYEKKDNFGLLDATYFLENYLEEDKEGKQKLYESLFDTDIKYAKILNKKGQYNVEEHVIATNYRYKYGASAENISNQLGEYKNMQNHAELRYKEILENTNEKLEKFKKDIDQISSQSTLTPREKEKLRRKKRRIEYLEFVRIMDLEEAILKKEKIDEYYKDMVHSKIGRNYGK